MVLLPLDFITVAILDNRYDHHLQIFIIVARNFRYANTSLNITILQQSKSSLQIQLAQHGCHVKTSKLPQPHARRLRRGLLRHQAFPQLLQQSKSFGSCSNYLAYQLCVRSHILGFPVPDLIQPASKYSRTKGKHTYCSSECSRQ